jgi:hypothetical protein
VWVIFSVVVILIAARIALTPLVKYATQKGLDSVEGMVGAYFGHLDHSDRRS